MATTLTQLLDKYKTLGTGFGEGVAKFAGNIISGDIDDAMLQVVNLGPIDTVAAAELQGKVSDLTNDVNNENLRTEILEKQIDIVQKRLNVSREEAANFTRSFLALRLEDKGLDAHRIMSALNADQKRILKFSEDPTKLLGVELETVLQASAVFSIAAGVALQVSIFLFMIVLFRGGAKAAKALGTGSIVSVAQAIFTSAASKLGFAATATFLISQSLGHLGTNLPVIVNQLVDLGTITPTMRAQSLVDIEKLKLKTGQSNIFNELKGTSGLGGEFGAAAPRETRSKQTQYKIFVGTLLGGRVAEGKDFHPIIDDEITDTQDLVEGAMSNLVKFLPTMPSRMTWEIQVKNSPFDENGVRQSGFWLTFSVYYVSRWNKRTFLDEFLLGPVNPARYPVLDRESVSVTTPLLSGDLPAMGQAQTISAGRIATTDREGNKIEVLPASTRSTESAPLSGGTGAPQSSVSVLEAQRDQLLKQKLELERSIAFASSTPPADFVSRLSAENAAAKAPEGIRTASGQALGRFFPEIGMYENQIVLADVSGSALHLREYEGLKAPIISLLPHKTQMTIKGFQGFADGMTWVNVNVIVNGREKNGAVAAQFLMAE